MTPPVTAEALNRLEDNLRREIAQLKELHAEQRAADETALKLKATETDANTRQWVIGFGVVISLISVLLRLWKP